MPVVMEDVKVTSFSIGDSAGGLPRAAGDDAPTESVSLNFAEVGMNYFGSSASTDGSPTGHGTILTGDAPAAEGKVGPFMGVLSDYPTGKAPDDAALDFAALANPAPAGQSSGLGDTATHEVGHWMGLYDDAVSVPGYTFTTLMSDTGGQLGRLIEFDLV